MKEKITKYKRYIISITLILMLSVLFINMKYLLPKKYEEIPEVKLKEIVNKDKAMAVMISNDGTNYQEYKSDTWPGNGYKFKEAKCIDNSGSEIKEAVTYEDGKITLTTDKTIYCTVYFDYKGTINILRENDPNNTLSSDKVGEMYRYQGLYTNDVRNYICLGIYCCNTEECSADTNDYMYRIIGITPNGELKVIKKTALTNVMDWSINSEIDIKWPDSDLFHKLNDYEEGTEYMTNSFYNQLNPKLKNIILKDYKWLYGDTDNMNNLNRYNGDKMYAIESGNESTTHGVKDENGDYKQEVTQWDENTYVNAPIGLMYVHDYLYAYPGGNPSNQENAVNSWIHLIHNEKNHAVAEAGYGWEWTIVRSGYYSNKTYTSRGINPSGVFMINDKNEPYAVRPIFYLNNEIEISGKGTLDDPFMIDI